MILAPIAGAVGLTLVTASHVIPIAIAQELAPSYTPENAAVFDTFASACLLLNYFGNVFNWAVATPLYAAAILTTGALPRWVGYVGLIAAVFAGWLGLFAPLSGLIEGLTTIGFLAFFVFLISMGITILRRRVYPGPKATPKPLVRQSPRWVGARGRSREKHCELYTMRPNGQDRRRLTNNHVPDTQPDWAPGGNRLT